MQSARVENQLLRKPEWLRQRLPKGPEYEQMKTLLRRHNVSTVCKEAQCPNQFECYSRGTATIMIMGDKCTRNCRYCAVSQHPSAGVDNEEPLRVAETVFTMNLKYVVITSVTRDDLPDGGASHFKKTIQEIHRLAPGTRVEVLIPDLQGNWAALHDLLKANPDILNHNMETVPRLYSQVRHEADYRRSLDLLRQSKINNPKIPTKSGLMLGLGETFDELTQSMDDLLDHGCDILTLGQYLQPSRAHLRVQRYITPDEFDSLKVKALALGFKTVASGPGVRSSYNAGTLYEEVTAFIGQ